MCSRWCSRLALCQHTLFLGCHRGVPQKSDCKNQTHFWRWRQTHASVGGVDWLFASLSLTYMMNIRSSSFAPHKQPKKDAHLIDRISRCEWMVLFTLVRPKDMHGEKTSKQIQQQLLLRVGFVNTELDKINSDMRLCVLWPVRSMLITRLSSNATSSCNGYRICAA